MHAPLCSCTTTDSGEGCTGLGRHLITVVHIMTHTGECKARAQELRSQVQNRNINPQQRVRNSTQGIARQVRASVKMATAKSPRTPKGKAASPKATPNTAPAANSRKEPPMDSPAFGQSMADLMAEEAVDQ